MIIICILWLIVSYYCIDDILEILPDITKESLWKRILGGFIASCVAPAYALGKIGIMIILLMFGVNDDDERGGVV